MSAALDNMSKFYCTRLHDIYIMSAALGNLSKLNCARLHDISVSSTNILTDRR